ncbi:hypothetical protein SLEP1_g7009 [Rubroshorea leprosula]|uniref:Uncharacterized protein n=1 Tax=Rubroshorea leprosula TaxID=152421 RepID=A0AAV5I7Y6_9ROSI|nr:hypothetical protein SLEP1_g7009 [Rubroshorea leprosula]
MVIQKVKIAKGFWLPCGKKIPSRKASYRNAYSTNPPTTSPVVGVAVGNDSPGWEIAIMILL